MWHVEWEVLWCLSTDTELSAEQDIWFGRIIHGFFFPIPTSSDSFPRATGCTCCVAKTMRWLLHVNARYFRYSRPSSPISRLLHVGNREKLWSIWELPDRSTATRGGCVWLLSQLWFQSSCLRRAVTKYSASLSNSDFYTWGGFFSPPHNLFGY